VSSFWAEAMNGTAALVSMLEGRRAAERDHGGGEARAPRSGDMRASFLAALGTLDSMALLAGSQHAPYIIDSEEFSTGIAGARLTVAGPLLDGHRTDELPAEAILLEPRKLGAVQTTFRLRADAAGRRGATYIGTVLASGPDASELVTVWIVVP